MSSSGRGFSDRRAPIAAKRYDKGMGYRQNSQGTLYSICCLQNSKPAYAALGRSAVNKLYISSIGNLGRTPSPLIEIGLCF